VKRTGRSDFIVALILAALGILLLIDAREISLGVGYDRIGPRFFPYLVATGLILLGVVLVFARGRRGFTPTGETQSLNWRALLYIGGALVLFVLLLDPAGFIVASCIQFWLVARALHSARPARDLTVGILLSIVVYVVFSRGLGLTLPAGALF
jgi:putative tricarboxylic transport membrane protein